MNCLNYLLTTLFNYFHDDQLTFFLNFKKNEINKAYAESISNFRLRLLRKISISIIILMVSTLLVFQRDSLKKILPYNLVLISMVLIFSKKYLWLIYVYSIIQTLCVFYVFIDGIIMYDLSYSLIKSYKKYFHYGIMFFLS